jgi:hypothetical protein
VLEVRDMQDTELFLSLAGIAGVFVGFGALISTREGGASEPQEVSAVRVVVAMGVMTIIGTLAPVTLGRYDLTDHQVLALSSVLVLVGSLGMTFIHIRTPEYKAFMATPMGRSRIVEVVQLAAWVLLVGGAILAPIVIVLGVAPELEAALYFTVLVLLLLVAAWALMSLVFMQRRPASA